RVARLRPSAARAPRSAVHESALGRDGRGAWRAARQGMDVPALRSVRDAEGLRRLQAHAGVHGGHRAARVAPRSLDEGGRVGADPRARWRAAISRPVARAAARPDARRARRRYARGRASRRATRARSLLRGVLSRADGLTRATERGVLAQARTKFGA